MTAKDNSIVPGVDMCPNCYVARCGMWFEECPCTCHNKLGPMPTLADKPSCPFTFTPNPDASGIGWNCTYKGVEVYGRTQEEAAARLVYYWIEQAALERFKAKAFRNCLHGITHRVAGYDLNTVYALLNRTDDQWLALCQADAQNEEKSNG